MYVSLRNFEFSRGEPVWEPEKSERRWNEVIANNLANKNISLWRLALYKEERRHWKFSIQDFDYFLTNGFQYRYTEHQTEHFNWATLENNLNILK